MKFRGQSVGSLWVSEIEEENKVSALSSTDSIVRCFPPPQSITSFLCFYLRLDMEIVKAAGKLVDWPSPYWEEES